MKGLKAEKMLKINGGSLLGTFLSHSIELYKGEAEYIKEYNHDHPKHAGSQHYHGPSDHETRQDID